MVVVILGMLLCIGLAMFVVASATLPALRRGATVLTPQGEALVADVRDKADEVRTRAADGVAAVRDRVGKNA